MSASLDLAAADDRSWSLSRVLLGLVFLAYLGLLADVRIEHVDVVRHHWEAWIPIAFSAFMALVSLMVVVVWNGPMRRMFFWLSFLGLVVGGLGFYFHNEEHLGNIQQIWQAWYMRMHHGDDPPMLAPLAFAGLGVLGLLATARRFQPRVVRTEVVTPAPAAAGMR